MHKCLRCPSPEHCMPAVLCGALPPPLLGANCKPCHSHAKLVRISILTTGCGGGALTIALLMIWGMKSGSSLHDWKQRRRNGGSTVGLHVSRHQQLRSGVHECINADQSGLKPGWLFSYNNPAPHPTSLILGRE